MGVKVRWNAKAAQFYIYVNHQKRRKAYPAGVNEAKAQKLAKEKREHLARTGLGLPAVVSNAPTLAVYLPDWLVSLQARCKTSSIDNYRREVQNHVLPVLGARTVDSLTKVDCQGLIQHWARTGLSTQTLRLMLATLRAALSDATAYLPVNPALKLRKECRQPNEIAFEAQHYSATETADLLTAAKTAPEPYAYTLFLLILRTGMRLGEALALQWSDIDLARFQMTVQRSKNPLGMVTSPKRGKRYVDLSEEVVAHLNTLPKDQPLWPSCDQHQTRCLFHRVRKIASLRHIRIHDLRHTFASQLLEAGVPIHYVSKQLGHSTIQMTVDKYGHLVKGANREWMNRLTP